MLDPRRAAPIGLTIIALSLGLFVACGRGQTKLSAAACDKLVSDVGRALAEFDKAHDRCEKNEDCVRVARDACVMGCGVIVAAASTVERRALEQRLEAGECRAWEAGGCPITSPMPVPSCSMGPPVCDRGRCATGPARR